MKPYLLIVTTLMILAGSCKRDHHVDVQSIPPEISPVDTTDADTLTDPVIQLSFPQEGDSVVTPPPPPPPPPDPQNIRILALGDSYTIGESVDSALRWPAQLAERLDNEDLLNVTELKYIAQTGWTTGTLTMAMNYEMIDTAQYDLVSLLIGVNNQFIGAPIEDYADQFENLLERAVNIAGGDLNRVFVVSIPDYGFTPYGDSNNPPLISAALQPFNDTCMVLSQQAGVDWFNITPISQQYPGIPGLVAEDGLHPSGYQYELWVDSFFEDVLEKFDE